MDIGLKPDDLWFFHPIAFLEHLQKLEVPFLFPLRFRPKESYHEDPRKFGSTRIQSDGTIRLHAGCDLYAPVGTEILAVKDGKVIDFYGFYYGTWVLDVDHGDFIVRYGEVSPDFPPEIKGKGTIIKQGQVIGYVGSLIKKGKPLTDRYGKKLEMLHFEMYSGKMTGDFRDDSSKYCRRGDLIDPSDFLDNDTIH